MRQQVLGGLSALTAPGQCLHSSGLNHVAGVIQLKNNLNLPLWGYFYPGISPLCWTSTQIRTRPLAAHIAQPSENNRYSSWGRKQVSPLLSCPGLGQEVTEQGQLSQGDMKAQ